MRKHPIIYFKPGSNGSIIEENTTPYIVDYSMIYNNFFENKYQYINKYQFIKNWKIFGFNIRKYSK